MPWSRVRWLMYISLGHRIFFSPEYVGELCIIILFKKRKRGLEKPLQHRSTGRLIKADAPVLDWKKPDLDLKDK
jgi:hypothetical protein